MENNVIKRKNFLPFLPIINPHNRSPTSLNRQNMLIFPTANYINLHLKSDSDTVFSLSFPNRIPILVKFDVNREL